MSTSETLVPSVDEPGGHVSPPSDLGERAQTAPPPAPPDIPPEVAAAVAAPSPTPNPTPVELLEGQLREIERAILVLAGAVRDQRHLLAADIDDIVAHQVVALRHQVAELASRTTAPAEDPHPTLVAAEAEPRTRGRRARRARRAASGPGRRGQLLIPSLFLLGGLAGGAAIGLSPYSVGDARCEGPLSVSVAALRDQVQATPIEACDQAAADRMLLATVPALGGVMAAVAMVVMRESPRRSQPRPAPASA